jgi:hypothetical protein
MTLIRTIWTSKSNLTSTSTYVARQGEIWYDSNTGNLRYSDGATPGGIPIVGSGGGGGGTLTINTFTDISKVVFVDTDFVVVSTETNTVNVQSITSSNIDGGEPDSIYGGVPIIDAGPI